MDIHVAFSKIQATLSEDITPFKVTQQFMPCFSTKFNISNSGYICLAVLQKDELSFRKNLQLKLKLMYLRQSRLIVSKEEFLQIFPGTIAEAKGQRKELKMLP